jgi:hypothetical protein
MKSDEELLWIADLCPRCDVHLSVHDKTLRGALCEVAAISEKMRHDFGNLIRAALQVYVKGGKK